MSSNDPLANVLSKINNAERTAKNDCFITVTSKLINNVLKLMQDNGYLGSFEEVDTSTGKRYKINLINKINKCNAVKPRFSVKVDEYVKFEKRFLPARDFGILIMSTPKGVMTQEEAKSKNLGGKIIAFCY